MNLISSPRASVQAYRGGGGCLVLFGLPFLGAGLAVVIASLTASEGPPWFLGVPLGLVFTLVGTGLVFGRSGMTIDRSRRTVDRWWGLVGVPFKREQTRLDDVDAVTVTREIRRGDKRSYTVYPVRLSGAVTSINIDEPQDPAKARAAAEKLAEFLQMPIRDSSTGREQVRQPDDINLSLRERVRQKGLSVEVPDAPARLKSKVTFGNHLPKEEADYIAAVLHSVLTA